MSVTLHHGDCLEVLRTMADASVDVVVTDPPAGIGFMNRSWDKAQFMGTSGGHAMPSVAHASRNPTCQECGGRQRAGEKTKGCTCRQPQWNGGELRKADRTAFVDFLTPRLAEARRVSKPGSYMLCWALPRTSHWTGLAIEDAGWVIRDRVSELLSAEPAVEAFVGSLSDDQRDAYERMLGSLGVSRIEHLFGSGFPKSKSCLKPGMEDWWLAWNPAAKVTPLNIDACRIPGTVQAAAGVLGGYGGGREGSYELGTGREYRLDGRWPANFCHDGSPKVLEAFAAFGEKTSGTGAIKRTTAAGYQANAYGKESRAAGTAMVEYGDSGSAARFFYCAKASRSDRNEGCEGLPESRSVDDDWVSESRKDAASGGKTSPQANHHPTVKPHNLMKWLVRLVCPPGGTVLDCFMGSGSTGKAAVAEGFSFVGVDQSSEYVDISRRRIGCAESSDPGLIPVRKEVSGRVQGLLFGGAG